ncbi:MAG: nuclear transport factor 2 family protein [Pseudomonadota bacterium]
MTDPLEAQVAWLVANEKIRNVIARYAKAGDDFNDPDEMGKIFTEDAVWEAIGFGRFEGRDSIVAELATIGKEKIIWSLHFPATPIIDLNASLDAAKVSWWLWELMTMREEQGDQNRWMGATYDADFVRAADAWRIKHLTLNIQKMVPFEEGPPPS